MIDLYSDYFLSDNPFPTTPILDPSSEDDRINGTIYNSTIMTEEIRSFERKIRRRPPLIYIENSDFVRGVGKSALIVQQWRRLHKEKEVTSIYLRSEKKLKPADFAARLINYWSQGSYLWNTLLHALTGYAKDNPRGEITPSGAEAFVDTFPQLPWQPISLLHFMVYNPDQLITDLAARAHRQAGDGLPLELAQAFFKSYLSDPRTFPDVYSNVLRRHKWDNISMIGAVYHLLRLGGYKYHYLFLDQFEDVVHGLSGKGLITFNTEMRRLIEASIGQATLIVTLHPGATNTLSGDEGGDITSIAPLDQRHVVDVRRLTEDGASQLVQTYLDHFRLTESSPPDPLYPFTRDAIKDIYRAAKGNIRACLQAFNYAIEKGIDEECPTIDEGFLARHHADITGSIHPDEVIL